MKKYNETELFIKDDYESYIEKIDKIIINVIEEYNVKDLEYIELSREEINVIYNAVVSNKKIGNCSNSPYKKICPRCGKDFYSKSMLNIHLNNINVCQSKCIDVSRDNITSNYNLYYNDYIMKYDFVSKGTTFACFRCGENFTRKFNLLRHMDKTNKCEIIYMDVSTDFVRNNYRELEKTYNSIKLIKDKKLKKQETKHHKETEEKNKSIVCEYCQAKFTRKNNYYAHKKHTCKVKKNLYQEYLKTQVFIDSRYDELKEQYEKQQRYQQLNEQKQQQEIEILKEELKLLKSKIDKINNSISDNPTTNTYTNYHEQLIEQADNSIIINNYGQEDISSITQEIFEKIASSEYSMIQKLIKYIHYTIESNRNIYIPSHKEKYALVFKNNNWNLVNKKDLINELVSNNHNLLDKLFDKYKNNLKYIDPNRTKQVLEYCGDDPEERIKIKEDVLITFLNKRRELQDTYEKK